MGKLFNQPARGEHDKVTMGDLAHWVEEIQREQGCLVKLGMEPVSINSGEAWSLWVKAVPASFEASPALLDEARMRWPTTTHKTVLGAFLYLLMKLEQQMAASAALDALSTHDRQT